MCIAGQINFGHVGSSGLFVCCLRRAGGVIFKLSWADSQSQMLADTTFLTTNLQPYSEERLMESSSVSFATLLEQLIQRAKHKVQGFT